MLQRQLADLQGVGWQEPCVAALGEVPVSVLPAAPGNCPGKQECGQHNQTGSSRRRRACSLGVRGPSFPWAVVREPFGGHGGQGRRGAEAELGAAGRLWGLYFIQVNAGPPGPEPGGRILDRHRVECVGRAVLASLCLPSRFGAHTPPCPLTAALLFQYTVLGHRRQANTPKCHRYF